MSARDLAVLQFLATAREAAQYQIHALLFEGRSEVVVSRCVRRLLGFNLIAVDRWKKVGINRLRLTATGADLLVDRGAAAQRDIHVAQRPTADKDVAHSLWVVDLLVIFRRCAPEVHALPCWAVRRKLGAAAGVSVPDVLALPRSDRAAVVAVEVDRATERMAVVLEKLIALDASLAHLAADTPATILFLTIGPRRVLAIQNHVNGHGFRSSVIVAELPKESGRPGLAALVQTVIGPHA